VFRFSLNKQYTKLYKIAGIRFTYSK